MLVQFHTPHGIVHVDSDTVTDEQLAALRVSREAVNRLVAFDPLAEIESLKVRVEKLENK